MNSMAIIKNLSIAAVGTVFLTLGAGKAAQAAVINFDSLSPAEVVDNQYVDVGVDFNGNASVLSIGAGLNEASFPPASGRNVVYNDPVLTSSSDIRVDAVGLLWQSVGAYITGNDSVTLTAYTSDDSIVGTASTGGANYVGATTGLLPNIFLSITAPDIAYVTFTDEKTGNSYTLDDFTYEAVPEPLTVGGSLVALGFGWLMKKKIASSQRS